MIQVNIAHIFISSHDYFSPEKFRQTILLSDLHQSFPFIRVSPSSNTNTGLLAINNKVFLLTKLYLYSADIAIMYALMKKSYYSLKTLQQIFRHHLFPKSILILLYFLSGLNACHQKLMRYLRSRYHLIHHYYICFDQRTS